MSVNLSRLEWSRAIARAAESKPFVRCVGLRSYRVASASRASGWYRIEFSINGSHRFGACDCPHGLKLSEGRARVKKGDVLPAACKHLAAALELHLHFAARRAAGDVLPAFAPDPLASPVMPPPSPVASGAGDDELIFNLAPGELPPPVPLVGADAALRHVRAVLRAMSHVEDVTAFEISDLVAWERDLTQAATVLERVA